MWTLFPGNSTKKSLFKKIYFQVALAGSIFMAGLFFGSGFAGRISDTFGRRMGILTNLVILALAQLAGGFMPGYWTYVATRFFAALGEQSPFIAHRNIRKTGLK